MEIEHVAFQVPDADKAAQWFIKNLGMKEVRRVPGPPLMIFIGDQRGSMVELYNNPKAPVPDYKNQHALVLHLAFTVKDMEADHARLLAAGATADGGITQMPSGDKLAFLRDPHGFVIQLCQRVKPMR